MELQKYTDDGYKKVQLEPHHVDVVELISVLYDKGLLNADEVNSIIQYSNLEVKEFA